MQTNLSDRSWTISEAPNHPLAKKFKITERQFRRAVQHKKINYVRLGGLVIRFTHEQIVAFIEDSTNAPLKRGGSL